MLTALALLASSFFLQGLEEDYAALAEQLDGSNVTVAKFQVGRWQLASALVSAPASVSASLLTVFWALLLSCVLALPARRQGCALQGAGPIPLQPGLEPQGWHACWLRLLLRSHWVMHACCRVAAKRVSRALIAAPPALLPAQADVERDFAAEKFGLKTFPTLVLLPKGAKAGECSRGLRGRGS